MEGEGEVVEGGRRRRCSRSTEVVREGGWEGTAVEEQIGLLTAGGRSLFELSMSWPLEEASEDSPGGCSPPSGSG